MSDRARTIGKALSLMIVSMIALGGAAALVGSLTTPARGATCDQGSNYITGDWTINTVQVCTGITYTVKGSITVASGGSLTLVGGGLNFMKDTSHEGYALTVNAGGSLTLDNSIVTTETVAISPYLKLALTVGTTATPGGTLTMQNGAVLKFPGWFNASGATISLTDSAITGFLPGDISNTGVYVGDNDNSPLISWSGTTATLFQSQIARIYENGSASGATGPVTGPVEGNVSLRSGSTLTAYDSYIGVDYSNVIGLHNEIQVDGNSNAYLYNVTIDRTQDPVSESLWQPAYVPLVAGGTVNLFRWLHVLVLDATGFPVTGAAVWASLSPANTIAQYPDNGGSITPTATTLTYLGHAASGPNAWFMTDASGTANLPLYTDKITTSTLPNAFSFGNYALNVTFGTAQVTDGVNFNAYPANNWQDNNIWGTATMSTVHVRTGPDLALKQSDYPGTKDVIEGQPFPVYALVYNLGQTAASGASVAAWLNGSRANELARVNNLNIAAGGMLNVTLNITAGIPNPGPHTLELVADPDNTVDQGGPAALNNNFANISLNVLPPPQGFLAIGTPLDSASFTPGTTISVTGNLKDGSARPISGITVTAELWQGSNRVAVSAPVVTDTNGEYIASLTIPSGTADGTYTLKVVSTAPTISPTQVTIAVRAPASFLVSPVPLLGIAWWLFLVILAAVVAVIVGLTLYFKVYGLGKMVECGECGSFIPEDATVCPRCGVEFEKDMAKCSNCSAWIPVDVKQCPECGIEFATGELDMADYQQKMRLQYDEVVQKLKMEAQRTLRRTLTDAEFQEWWRKQPTFLTFEDWLKEEEEVRKKGSRPCPNCGTLNSMSAKVCHTCGSLIEPQVQRAGTPGATRVGAPKRAIVRPQPTQPAAPSEEGEAAPEPSGPVVQKKVVRKAPDEEAGTEDQGDQNP